MFVNSQAILLMYDVSSLQIFQLKTFIWSHEKLSNENIKLKFQTEMIEHIIYQILFSIIAIQAYVLFKVNASIIYIDVKERVG